MSIFKRDCPECATSNPPDALLCACGYCFDPEALARTDPAAYARQQERLYREYLAARLTQAEADASAARKAARARPQDKSSSISLRAAQAALTALRTELEECTHRVHASPARSAAAPRPAQSAPQMSVRPAASAPRTAPSAQPSASFRQAQARKAESVVQTTRNAARPRVSPVSAKPAPVPAPAAPREASKACPNCTATVSRGAERCRCGYAFARPGEAVPALTLDAGALAILADGITLTGPSRRR